VRIAVVFSNVHMGLSHEGLTVLAKRKGFDPATLPSGQVLVFLNRSHDKLKIMTAGGHILGYLNDRGRRIALEAIQYIPQAFGNKAGIDYNQALKIHLMEVLKTKSKKSAAVHSFRDKGYRPSKSPNPRATT